MSVYQTEYGGVALTCVSEPGARGAVGQVGQGDRSWRRRPMERDSLWGGGWGVDEAGAVWTRVPERRERVREEAGQLPPCTWPQLGRVCVGVLGQGVSSSLTSGKGKGPRPHKEQDDSL